LLPPPDGAELLLALPLALALLEFEAGLLILALAPAALGY
jgi:hypothetical protein